MQACSFELRPWALTVSVFLTVMVCCSQAAGQEVDELLKPCAVPYECVSGLRLANATVSWRLSFDVRHAAIYDIVHWEIRYTDGQRTEYLAQLWPSGERMLYRFFVRERRGLWYTLGIRKRWVWRPVGRPSEEQNLMTMRLRQLYAIAKSLRDGADPTTLKF